MKRTIQLTDDGSHTIYIPEMDEHFHSVHGAIQESMHVFIENGLKACTKSPLNLLEIGFGTGLNALLSFLNRGEKVINYYSLEKFPLPKEEYSQLNYAENHSSDIQKIFLQMHQCEWEKPHELAENFSLTKINGDLKTIDFSNLPTFDLVYFDAFAPNKQPALWTDAIFEKISAHCRLGAIFTTYCAKGDVRRSLQKHGFAMQRLAGPPGKKHILYGEKGG